MTTQFILYSIMFFVAMVLSVSFLLGTDRQQKKDIFLKSANRLKLIYEYVKVYSWLFDIIFVLLAVMQK